MHCAHTHTRNDFALTILTSGCLTVSVLGDLGPEDKCSSEAFVKQQCSQAPSSLVESLPSPHPPTHLPPPQGFWKESNSFQKIAFLPLSHPFITGGANEQKAALQVDRKKLEKRVCNGESEKNQTDHSSHKIQSIECRAQCELTVSLE